MEFNIKIDQDLIAASAFIATTCLYYPSTVEMLLISQGLKFMVIHPTLAMLEKNKFISANTREILEVITDPTWALVLNHFNPKLINCFNNFISAPDIQFMWQMINPWLPQIYCNFLTTKGTAALSAAIISGFLNPLIYKTAERILAKNDNPIWPTLIPSIFNQAAAQFSAIGFLDGRILNGFMLGLTTDSDKIKGLSNRLKWGVFTSCNYVISKAVQDTSVFFNLAPEFSSYSYFIARRSIENIGFNYPQNGLDIFITSAILMTTTVLYCSPSSLIQFLSTQALHLVISFVTQDLEHNKTISVETKNNIKLASSCLHIWTAFQGFLGGLEKQSEITAAAFSNFTASINSIHIEQMRHIISNTFSARSYSFALILGGISMLSLGLVDKIADSLIIKDNINSPSIPSKEVANSLKATPYKANLETKDKDKKLNLGKLSIIESALNTTASYLMKSHLFCYLRGADYEERLAEGISGFARGVFAHLVSNVGTPTMAGMTKMISTSLSSSCNALGYMYLYSMQKLDYGIELVGAYVLEKFCIDLSSASEKFVNTVRNSCKARNIG